MISTINKSIRKFLNLFGYEIVKLKYSSPDISIGNWIKKLDIQTIIDIGSNQGQFIEAISSILPNKKIIAFEPIKSVFDQLILNTKKNPRVTAYNLGLSDENSIAEINISKNLVSSSIMNMEAIGKKSYPQSEYISKETIQLKKLDDVISINDISRNLLVKIDVQGYENKVIAGGSVIINAADVIIIEFSYEPIYEGQWLFDETYDYFTKNGFRFVGLLDQVANQELEVPLYGDAIFVKENLAKQLYKIT